jgi:GT2 family glycosyltransferase
MHPVLMLTRNNLELTKRAVESIYQQRIKSSAWIIDNGSKDGTVEWAEEAGILLDCSPFNTGVSVGWNHGLNKLFGDHGYEHVLVVGNDTVLPEYLYAALLSYDVPFVTGVAVDQMPSSEVPERMPLTENPDFSCFLIRSSAWAKIGPFNERFMHYCGDTDMHVRAHRLGIPLYKANVPYLHFRSSTLNNASPQDRAVIQAQAEADRGQFRAMYGCVPGDAEYEKLFEEG